MKFDIIKRLREPPPFTDTSERKLMEQAADEIERLRAIIEHVAHLNPEIVAKARDALRAPF